MFMNRLTRALLILVVFVLSIAAHSEENNHGATNLGAANHIMIDIDWTLLYNIDKADAHLEPLSVITYQGQYYRLTDYAVEFLELFHRHGLGIAFISGGDSDRNRQVIQAVYEKINAISDSVREIPQIYSRTDLTQIAPDDSGLPFTDRYKKNLAKYVGPDELQNTILIDDDPRFAVDGQRDNLFSFTAFRDILNYAKAKPTLPMGAFYPRNEKEYVLERHKFLIAGEVILEALEHRNSALSLVAEVRRRLNLRSGELMTTNNDQSFDIIRAGLQRLKEAHFQIKDRSKVEIGGRAESCKELFTH